MLLSTPSLWTGIDFSVSARSQQALGFLRRSGNQLIDVHQYLEGEDDDYVEPFLSTTLHNLPRLRSLSIVSCIFHLEPVLAQFTRSAPELKSLQISNDSNITERDVRLRNGIFGGRLPNLTSLTLHYIRTNLRGFNFPSLARFEFVTETPTSINDLTSFFERCPSLEFIKLSLDYRAQPPTNPPKKRVRLAALKELRLDQGASASGLIDRLALPRCTEFVLKGVFTGAILSPYGSPAARIHPSSIDHLPAMKGITKAVATPNSCIFSGPNGNVKFWCFDQTRKIFDVEFFTSFSPISISDIRELWVGQRTETYFETGRTPWKQTTDRVLGAFKVLGKVEDLTIVSCEPKAFFETLGSATDNDVLLPGLRRITVYVGCGNLDPATLIQCARARKGYSRQLEEVGIVLEKPDENFVRELEPLREMVGVLSCDVGKTPELKWDEE